MRKPKIEIVEDYSPTFGTPEYWWRLVGANSHIVCHSEIFPTKSNAVRAAKRAKVLMQKAEIVK